MKIAFLHRDLPPDSYTGVALQVHRLANALTRLGHSVTIFTHTSPSPEALYQVQLINSIYFRIVQKYFSPWKRLLFPIGYRFLSFSEFDIIHIHGDGGFLKYQTNYLRSFYGTAALERKFSLHWKGKLAQSISYLLEKRESQRSPLSTGISPHITNYLPQVKNIIPCMLPQPISETPCEKSTAPMLLFLGSRNSRKQGDAMLTLFKKIHLQIPTAILEYVSSIHDAESLKKTVALNSESWAKQIRISYKLSSDDLQKLYGKSWIYISLSTYEGFGVSLIEAMAAGCIVFSTLHPGSEFILQDGNNGYFLENSISPEKVIWALQNYSTQKKIGLNAQKFAHPFEPQEIAEKYLTLYATIKAKC